MNEADRDSRAAARWAGRNWPGPGGRGAAPPDVDLGRVWTGVAAHVWRREPGLLERTAG